MWTRFKTWVSNTWRRTSRWMIAAFGIPVAMAAATPVIDNQIDPYTESQDKYEIAAQSTLEAAGEIKTELSKTEPAITLSKWNGEAAMTVKYDKVQAAGARQFLTDRVEWKGDKEEVHAYPLEAKAGMEDGGFEIEIVLNEKPDTNVFEFQIEGAEELDFFYQPPLSQEEIDEGAFRPENVIGSYAVYHKTKANHRIGDTNYATGKVYHIYRPKMIDSNGTEEWAELFYSDGILSIIASQSFLDIALYPLIIDPTFGYTTAGAGGGSTICNNSADTSSSVGKTGDNTYPLTEDGTLDSMSAALTSGTGSTETVDTFYALYREDSAGADSHDLVASAETLDLSVTTATNVFYTINFASESVTADTYILTGLCDGIDIAGTGAITIRADTGGTNLRFYNESSTGAGGYATRKAENPWTEVDAGSTSLSSIYATYSVAAPAGDDSPKPSIIWFDVE